MTQYSLFPCSNEMKEDSLFNDLKKEFEKSKEINLLQMKIEKLGKRKLLWRFFSFGLISKIAWKNKRNNILSKLMVLFSSLVLFVPIFSIGTFNYNNFMFSLFFSLIVNFFVLYSYAILDLQDSYKFIEEKYRNFYRKGLVDLYPDFFDRTLNKDQMVKLKSEISNKYEFINIMSNQGSISYKNALNSLIKEHIKNKIEQKEKDKDIIIKRKISVYEKF